jgi:PAT family acetyl-CoA transporter-like MFS transporter 1
VLELTRYCVWSPLHSLLLLLVLYTLQGIPMGLAGSIPYILAEKGTSYAEQAQFSFVSWPFSLKLLWAPIVDSIYSESFGRRKTWLVPAQFAIAFIMLVGGQHADALLAEGDESQPADVPMLTVLFFSLFFLAATQDIAVDGWALTMLARRNIGHASTTNAVGQSFGVAISFSGFLALKAKGFCTLGSFMSGWSIVYFVTTVIVWLGKAEGATPAEEVPESATIVYRQMWDVLNLSAVKRLLLIMFTWKVGFAAADAIAALKLMEHGMPKEHMATVSMAMTPVMMILPMIVSSPMFEQYTGLSTAGKRPLSLIAMVYKPRLLMGVASAVFVYHVADLFPLPDGADVPYKVYAVLMLLSLIGAVFMTMMFVAQMAFFARVVRNTYLQSAHFSPPFVQDNPSCFGAAA